MREEGGWERGMRMGERKEDVRGMRMGEWKEGVREEGRCERGRRM